MKTSEKRRIQSAKNYQKNKAYYAAYSKNWWNTHRDKLRAKWRRRSKTPKGRAKAKKYRDNNLEKVRLGRRVWQSREWSHRQEYMRQYYLKNKEKIKSKVLGLYKKHPERWIGYGQKRRALQFGTSVDSKPIKKFIEKSRLMLTCSCYYCEFSFSPLDIHFDHVIPLAKGGTHTIGNICTSCAGCNLSKNDKLPSRWNKLSQLFLDL